MSGFGYNILGFGAFPNRSVEAGITSNAENVSAKAQFNATIWASGTPKILNISSGVTLGGTSGTAALTIESDLGGSLLIVNAGTIIGTGGAAGSSGAGGNGGNAILNSGGTIVSVTNSGTISGGGGGGGLGGTGGAGGTGTYTATNTYFDHPTYGGVADVQYTSEGGDWRWRFQSSILPIYSSSGGTSGGYTWTRGTTIRRSSGGTYHYDIIRTGTETQSGASGGAGGAGGAGAGYNQSQSDGSSGSSGASGSNNAGNGGQGGTGGNGGHAGADGSAGATGSTGSNGNSTNGSSGASGSAAGTAGKAISGAVNFTDASGTTNGTVDTV